jgi:D-arginine dehydrogenase
MTMFDVAIIGAGIAGASLAAEIGGEKSVLVLEAEDLPGYHATGRSAAFWTETYGGPAVQPLTSASGPFLAAPPKGFADGPLIRSRGALHLGRETDAEVARAMVADFARSDVALERLDDQATAARISGLRSGWTEALWEPNCCDIDVAALHTAYLKKARRAGVKLLCNTSLEAARYASGRWSMDAGGQSYAARILVNAAGAWADPVAHCRLA